MTKSSASILLYTIFFGFIAEDVVAIGLEPENVPLVTLFGVSVRDLALFVALCCLVIRHRQMLRIVDGRWLLLIVLCFLVGLVQGVLSLGFSRSLVSDIRVFLWFFGGIGFALVMERTRHARMHLTALLLLSTVLMVCASLFSPSYYEYELTGEAVRVTHPSIYVFGGLLAVPLILVTNTTGPRLRSKVVPAICLAAFFGFGALLSSTRSNLIITVVFLIILLASLRFRFREGTVMIGKATGVARTLVVSVGLMLVFLLPVIVDASRSERFASLLDVNLLLANSRVLELIAFLTSSDSIQLLIGRGVGGAVESPIFNGELTGSMHIGIANVWMKFGLLPFALAMGFFLLVVPIRYFRSFRKAQDPDYWSSTSDTANVVVLSSLFPWIVSMLLSGGYSEVNLWCGGIVFYVYYLVKRFGLDAFFSPSYATRTVPADA